MPAHFTDFDADASELLAIWEPAIGKPTCRKGCSNCCRVAVACSSAEALELLDYIRRQPAEQIEWFSAQVSGHVARMVAWFQEHGVSSDPLHDLWQMGNCPFLVDHACGIHEARPYACRAVHVWHSERFCGTPTGMSHVPVELVEQRDHYFWRAMLEEVEKGRLPFFGQQTVVLYYLMQHEGAYRSGGDLRAQIDAAWRETGLIAFPGEGSPAAARRTIEQAIEECRRVYAEDRPFGLPRVALVQSAAELQPDEQEQEAIFAAMPERRGDGS